MKFTFFCLCIQSHFSESFQDLFNVALVLRNIVRVDQDVIQVNYFAHIQEVREYIIHEVLEDSWSVN